MLGSGLLVDMLKGVAVASIGAITSNACRELGLKVDIEPPCSTLECLSEEIERHFHSPRNAPRQDRNLS
jgi:uroporphyrinogen III methyltransferase/synthase